VWAGRINLQAGRHLLSVEYGSEVVAAAIRERCAAWLSTDEREIAAAFGIRTEKVGLLRRRTIAVLHHGAPIRARFAGLDEALDALIAHLGEIEQLRTLIETRPGDVAVDARAFVRNGRLVLASAPASVDVDEDRLRRLGIEEIPTWRPLVRCAAGTVTIGRRSWPLHGVVMIAHRELALDDARRRAWALGTPAGVAWAERIDALGDRVQATRGDLYDLVDQALS
jgi:hypothetical protein